VLVSLGNSPRPGNGCHKVKTEWISHKVIEWNRKLIQLLFKQRNSFVHFFQGITVTFSGHTWFLFIIAVPLGTQRAEHCVLECLFTTTIGRPKNVLFWRHLRRCLNRTPGFSAAPHFLVFYPCVFPYFYYFLLRSLINTSKLAFYMFLQGQFHQN